MFLGFIRLIVCSQRFGGSLDSSSCVASVCLLGPISLVGSTSSICPSGSLGSMGSESSVGSVSSVPKLFEVLRTFFSQKCLSVSNCPKRFDTKCATHANIHNNELCEAVSF